jgi:CheY-like chemotaxis protein
MTTYQLNSILLVDDDEVTNFYVEHLIRKMNLAKEIHVAMSGQDALAYLNTQPATMPDLILLDINMPIMNGFEFLEAFETSPLSADYKGKIFMLTSSGLEQDRARASQFRSIAGYFIKPLDKDLLGNIVQQYGGAQDPTVIG